MKLVSVDLVDQEGASGMFQCRIQLGVVLNRWSCGAPRRGARLESDVCMNVIEQESGGIKHDVQRGVWSKALLARERAVTAKIRGFG
jgi:hypothetical protein